MQYSCYGHFYELERAGKKIPCRSSLLITREPMNAIHNVDLLVVMMNPGSSAPIEGKDLSEQLLLSKEHVPTKPDNTQSQIMKVMESQGYLTALVINLSDVREPKSSIFSRKLKQLSFASIGEKHSIFSDARNSELSNVLNACADTPVIFASGVNYKLRFLTQKALSKFDDDRVVGIKNNKELFYHPLPRAGKKQEQWVNKINSCLMS